MKRSLALFFVLVLTALLVSCTCGKSSSSSSGKEAVNAFNNAIPILGGAELGGFSWRGTSWPTAHTIVKVDRTSDGCFLAEFTCKYKKGTKLVRKGKKADDMNIFAGECVELFLCPDPAKKVYYQIAISLTGAAYTARGRDTSWNAPGLKKEIKVYPDHYKVTVKLPFKAMGIAAPAKDAVWLVNFCRTHFGTGIREASNWAGSGNYHDVRSYGRIAFSPKGSSAFITLDSFLCRSDLVQFKLSMNKVDAPMEVWIKRKEIVKKAGIIPPGKPSMAFRIKMPESYIPLKYHEKVTLLIKNAINGKTVFARDLQVNNSFPNFLVLNKFYYKKGDKINFRVQPAAEKKVKNVTILLKSGSKTLLKKVFAGNRGSIETKGFKPGRYVLEATDGTNVSSRLFFIREKDYAPKGLPANKPLVIKKGKPGLPGVLTMNGKDLFLIGASTPHNGASYPSQHCFNLSYGARYAVSPYAAIGTTPGKRLIRQPGTGYLYPPEKTFLANLVKVMAKKSTSRPSFHRLTYEAQLDAYFPGKKKGSLVKGDTYDIHKKMYDAIKARSPRLLISLQTERLETIPKFIHSCDILEIVPGGSYSIASMARLPEGIKAAADGCVATSTPVILWIGVTIPNNMCRRVEEVRATLYLSVMNGISGVIFHMGHAAMPKNNLRMWNFLSQILGEVQSFHGEFTSMDPVACGSLVKVTGKDFISRERSKGGKGMMLFVSTSAYENKVTFRAEKGYTFSCGKKELTMNLTPYETLVLRLKKGK